MTLLDALRDLYKSLDARLAGPPGNPCGDCRKCCTAEGLSYQNVQGVEYAHLEDRFGKPRADAFRAYAERREHTPGACPFYDLTMRGCGIYADRPFACRVFGHFRMQGTALPDACVFAGREREVARGAYFREVPLTEELRDLDRRFSSRQHVPLHEAAPEVTRSTLQEIRRNADPDDPFAMAFVAGLEGRAADALALLDRGLEERPEEANGHFQKGVLLDEMKRPGDAARSFARAVRLEPDNPRFCLHLAFSLLEGGDAGSALGAFQRAVALNPGDPTACGFLGYLLLAGGNAAGALPHLVHAVQGDGGNPFFRLRLGDALLRLGRGEEAGDVLRAAATDPRTRPEAEQLLERINV